MIYLAKILPVSSADRAHSGTDSARVDPAQEIPGLAACVFLYICSTPIVARFSLNLIEGGVERGRAADAPTADGIVVLSSGRLIAPGKARVSEWGWRPVLWRNRVVRGGSPLQFSREDGHRGNRKRDPRGDPG